MKQGQDTEKPEAPEAAAPFPFGGELFSSIFDSLTRAVGSVGDEMLKRRQDALDAASHYVSGLPGAEALPAAERISLDIEVARFLIGEAGEHVPGPRLHAPHLLLIGVPRQNPAQGSDGSDAR